MNRRKRAESGKANDETLARLDVRRGGCGMIRRSSSLYTKRLVFSAKSSARAANADTFQHWRPRFNTGDTLKYSGVVPRLHAGTWFEWQITKVAVRFAA